MIKLYTYKNCGTCKKATKWLRENSISFNEIPIRQTPPSKHELQEMLTQYNDTKYLFNTSGQDYRALNLKEKREILSIEEQIELLHTNGNLVKRPFLISESKKLVGFKVSEWEDAFKSE